MPNNCPNCAPYDCYHICPNSPFYYSAEQERADEAFYGEADRYEGWGDPDLAADQDCAADYEGEIPYVAPTPDLPAIDTTDDLPF